MSFVFISPLETLFSKLYAVFGEASIQDASSKTDLQENPIAETSHRNNNYYIGQLLLGTLVSAVLLSGFFGIWAIFGNKREVKKSKSGLAVRNDDFTVHWKSSIVTSTADDTARRAVSAAQQVSYRPDSTEFQVNTYTDAAQYAPDVTGYSTGGFGVSYESDGQDGDNYGVFVREFDADRQPEGPEVQANSFTTDWQRASKIVGLSDGGKVVGWESYDQDSNLEGVFIRRYYANGTAAGSEIQVNIVTALQQWHMTLTILADDNLLVTWSSQNQDTSGSGIYARTFDVSDQPAPLTTEVLVNTVTANHQDFSAAAASPNGDLAVTWTSTNQDGSSDGVYRQDFTSSLIPLGSETPVNTETLAAQNSPDIAFLANGISVEVWSSNFQDGDGYGIFLQDFDVSGNKLGNELQVNTYTLSHQSSPKVIRLDAGGFLVAWESSGQDGNGYGLYAQLYDDNRLRVGSEFQMNIYAIFDQRAPAIAAIKGGFVGVWHSFGQDGNDFGVQGRVFFADTPPRFLKNGFAIQQGEDLPITPDNILAMDSTTDNSTLEFTARNETHGNFKLRGVATKIFNSANVFANEVTFKHDGSPYNPYYELSADDGFLKTPFVPGVVGFSLQPDLLTIPLVLSGIGVALLCLSLTGSFLTFVILTGIWMAKHRKSSHDIEMEKVEGLLELSPNMKKHILNWENIKVTEEIGTGGSSKVFSAKWQGIEVAYKLMRAISDSEIADFEREAEIMITCTHPNIIGFFGVTVRPHVRRIGIVMELMPLGTLKNAIKTKMIRTWKEKYYIFRDIARVVDFLHSKKVYHRDLKTDNVMIKENTDGPYGIKLLDFGMSRWGVNEKKDVSKTMGIGTYSYMAPELVTGTGFHSLGPVDVFAVGMIFVEVVNEIPLYKNKDRGIHVPAKVGSGKLWERLDLSKCPLPFFKMVNLCRSRYSDQRLTASEIVKRMDEMENTVKTFEDPVKPSVPHSAI